MVKRLKNGKLQNILKTFIILDKALWKSMGEEPSGVKQMIVKVSDNF